MTSPYEPNPYQAPQSYGDAPRKFPLGAMSLGDILSRGLTLLFSRLPVFFLIELFAYIPFILFVIYSGVWEPEMMFATWFGVASVLANIVLGAFASAAVLKVIEQEYVDQRLGVGEALGFALSRGLPLIVTSVVYGLVVGVGTLLCIIPGIIFAVMFVFAPQACVLERLGPINAMNRSEKLTKGFRWRVLGILLVVGILNAVLSKGAEWALQAALGVLSQADAISLGAAQLLVLNLVPLLFGILVGTYASICSTLTYFDLRVRKEGFDLAVAARQGNEPGTPIITAP